MPKILLIEDEDYIRDLYKRQLDQAGLATDGVATGGEGLSALKGKKYDLVLLDIMLPDLNGLEVLKKVKEDSSTKDTRVVLLTNLGQDSIIKEGFTSGAEGYLLKAAETPDQIVAEVKNFLHLD